MEYPNNTINFNLIYFEDRVTNRVSSGSYD